MIDTLVEHRPDEIVEATDPEEYETLTTRPGFIAFRLRPRPEGWSSTRA